MISLYGTWEVLWNYILAGREVERPSFVIRATIVGPAFFLWLMGDTHGRSEGSGKEGRREGGKEGRRGGGAHTRSFATVASCKARDRDQRATPS